MSSSPPDVMGHAEVRKYLGVSRQGLDHIRGKAGESFPRHTQLDSGPVWDRKSIIEWKKANRS